MTSEVIDTFCRYTFSSLQAGGRQLSSTYC